MPSLTVKDLEDLEFMAAQADVIGLSFVRTPEDVGELEEQLRKHNALNVGVVLKIENRQGFENLPRLILATMRTPPDGIMVARGDLAAEIGFERMAEVQEEILWFCEAAHIPVIWAQAVFWQRRHGLRWKPPVCRRPPPKCFITARRKMG